VGLLVDGIWYDQWYDTESTGGRFQRQESAFRGWLGTPEFPAECGRYHLYVSLACPWAHRTLIFRKLKALEACIAVSVVHPHMLENGWAFRTDREGATGDRLYGKNYLHQLYTLAMPNYTGRVTVPTLWDKQNETIVSNESADIIRTFNTAFDGITGNRDDYYPPALQPDIDALNETVYHNINNGVYKAGFATTQTAYEEAVRPLFETLDWLEARLAQGGPYLFGDRLTEADWRLFTTLIRFDPVYVGHFKCNLRRIADYPALCAYLRRLYEHPGVAETVNFDHIKTHYYYSHQQLNPTRIVPVGPASNLPWDNAAKAGSVATANSCTNP